MTTRTAFITGASRGIGRACSIALSEAGARVALAARSIDQLEELAGQLRLQGREAFAVQMDLANVDSIKEAFARTTKDFGPVSILVNNAGRQIYEMSLRQTSSRYLIS